MEATRANILIIEDSDLDYEMSVRAIQQVAPRMIVHRAKRCSQAAVALEEMQPRLVILDVNLGACSGLALLERCRSSCRAKMPVVVFSSSTNAHDRQQAQRLGALAFVEKPLHAEEFIAAVEQLVVAYLN